MDRWAADPAMHVYHYAAYERTALGRLSQRHGTREEEVDRLLRGRVLVDLFRVVRQGILAGVESYSIKRIEPLYALHREVELKDAGSSIVAFETWLEMGPGRAGGGRPGDPHRHRGLQPRRRREQLAPPRLAGGAPAGPRGPRGAARTARRSTTASRAPSLTERDQAVAELAAALTVDDPGDPVVRAPRTEVRAAAGCSPSSSHGTVARTSRRGGATTTCWA